MRHDIPAVTVADALVQAADTSPPKALRVAFDDAVRRELTTGAELEQAQRRLEGVLPGAEVIRADTANPAALRDRILAVRGERLRAGVSTLRDFFVATR